MKIKTVLPKNFTECERFAQGELEKFLSETALSGTGGAADYTYHLGFTDSWREKFEDFPIDDLKPDGFAVKTVGDEIYIFGARDRGTLYGVYDFLEKFAGIRFVAIDETYVPPVSACMLDRPDYVSVPDIKFRSYRVYQLLTDPLFAARMRMIVTFGQNVKAFGGGIERDFFDCGHNTLSLVPPEKYFASHPEFYYVADGKPKDLCWSNGVTDDGRIDESLPISVPAVLADAVIEYCKNHDEVKYFMVAQEDSLGDFCPCEKCRERATRFGAFSANLVLCLGAVAERVNEWAKSVGREINIVTFAYNATEKPPILKGADGALKVPDGLKLHKNLFIKIAMSNADFAHSFVSPKQKGSYMHDFSYEEVFRGWKMLTDNFMFYDYGTNFYEHMWFFPNRKVMAENYAFYKSLNAEYVETEAEHEFTVGFQPDLKCYIASKLLWNTSADVDELTKEFCDLYYGESAHAVLDVIKLLEDMYAEADERFDDFSMHMFLEDWGRELDSKYLDKTALVKSAEILREEIKRITTRYGKDCKFVKRLQKVIITPLTMLLKHSDKFLTDTETQKSKRELKETCMSCGVVDFGGKVTLEKTGVSYGGTVYDV